MLEMMGYFGPIRSTIGPVPLRKQTSAARIDSSGRCRFCCKSRRQARGA